MLFVHQEPKHVHLQQMHYHAMLDLIYQMEYVLALLDKLHLQQQHHVFYVHQIVLLVHQLLNVQHVIHHILYKQVDLVHILVIQDFMFHKLLQM